MKLYARNGHALGAPAQHHPSSQPASACPPNTLCEAPAAGAKQQGKHSGARLGWLGWPNRPQRHAASHPVDCAEPKTSPHVLRKQR
jgi:hypothetical protein